MSWLRLMEENIKQQNEPVQDATPTEAITYKAPVKGNRVSVLIREMWPAYLIEVFVIILGISVTLAMEKWRDNSKEERLERIYQKNLLTDIEVDNKSLAYTITNTQQLLARGNELLSDDGNTLSPEKVDADVKAILGRPDFRSSDATFSDLKNSGNLHLLKDIDLKNSLFAYYSATQNIKELQDAEQLATINISGPFFLKRFQMDNSTRQGASTASGNYGDLLKSIEFRNNVLLRVNNRQELLVQYQNTCVLYSQVKKALLANLND